MPVAAAERAPSIHRQPIRETAAWTAADLAPDAKARMTRRLSAAELAAADDFLARTRNRAPWETTAKDAPGLKTIADDVGKALKDGHGMIVVQGFDRSRLSKDDCERVFWAIGTFLGDATMQNPKGDRITHVKHDKDVPAGRGYRSTAELSPHTDAYAILCLMCLERAETGGVTRATSALAVYNEILASRPELLEPMYRGTRYASSDARGTGVGPTAKPIPLFSSVNDKVSCFFSRQNMSEAARQTGQEIDPLFAEAADYFQKLALDPRFMVEFMLEP
ncbi:MAG TPA: TauD/TfdA family dioxygenase, partial [Burkholderiales bacterium]|nr:TauD/TfdA family dioxygenase [Burkholderiales bacterium]